MPCDCADPSGADAKSLSVLFDAVDLKIIKYIYYIKIKKLFENLFLNINYLLAILADFL